MSFGAFSELPFSTLPAEAAPPAAAFTGVWYYLPPVLELSVFKNTASQKIVLFAFDYSTGAPKTGDAANLTAYVSKDDGSVTVLGDTSATELDSTNAKGLYSFDLTQAETNADKLIFSGKSSTSNVALVPVTVYTVPANLTSLNVTNLNTLSGHDPGGTLATATAVAGVQADTDDILARLPAALTSNGNLKASFVELITTALTETTTGRLKGAFTTLFDVASPVLTAASVNQTGDSFARIGSTGSGLTSLAPASTALSTAQWTNARAGYLDNLNIGGNVASSAEVTAIQNNTRVVRVVPDVIERPDSGTTTYRVELFLYDDTGNMEAPDSAPTIALVNQAGTDRSSRLDSTTMSLVETGRYRAIYTASVGDTLEQLVWTFSVVEGGATRKYGNQSVIVDTTAVDFTSTDRTQLQAIYAKLPSKSNLTGTNNSDGDVQLDEATGNYPGTVARVTLTDTATTLTNAPPDSAGVTTLLARLGAFAGSGVNTVLGFFRALFRSDASTPSDVGGTFNPATDSLEAQRDNVGTTGAALTLAKGTNLTGFNDLDAAGIRSAVGLASANLDTQLGAIDDYIDTEVAAIKSQTDKLGFTGSGPYLVNAAAAVDEQAIADAVVDALGAIADPLLNIVPGDYDEGTAGNALGRLTGTAITVTGPVAAGGNATVLKGDSYLAADGRSLSWSASGWQDLTGLVVTFVAHGPGGADFTKAMTVVTAGAGTQTVRLELTHTETASLARGTYDFEILATLGSGGKATLVRATLTVGGE